MTAGMADDPETARLFSIPDDVRNVFPANSGERVNAFAHYYRAEISRSLSWRDRLDRTTNWAIAAMAAILSVSLSQPHQHHGLLLFAMTIVFLLLLIESRRYRYFEISRRRTRLFERGYHSQVISPSSAPEGAWLKELAASLRSPEFTITLSQAMAHRLRRNYIWIFLILLAAWLLKVVGSVEVGHIRLEPASLHLNAGIGWTPGWLVLLLVVGFYAYLGYIMVRYGSPREERLGEAHV
jgi:uncharacterized membrane protein